MELSARQRHALEAICDTFCPEPNGVPSAGDLGVVDALLDALTHARVADQKQLKGLLTVWDTALVTVLGRSGPHRFSKLPRERREKVLLSWCDSRISQQRAAFQALRKGALLFYYMLPAPNGGRSPVWDAMGYPGPLGPVPDPRPKTLRPETISRDTALDCDVVVVGSGAGGGTAAGVLAAAGLAVVVVEAGGYYDEADFDGSEFEALTGYYQAAPTATADQSATLLAGACLGGGTVVNYSTSFRTPDEVRAEWAGHGVPAFTTDEYTRSLDAVCERLGVNLDHNRPSTRDAIMRVGCAELGWHIDAMPRNVEGCDQALNCGYCGFGCRLGAKRSTTATWLADAHAAGTRLLVSTRAERVLAENGVALGVSAVTAGGHRVTIRSRAVIAACGALHTPALLRRSGLTNPNIGKNLKLHPATVVFGIFDEELRPWEGTMQALYSDQHRDLHEGYGLKYETAPLQPHLMTAFAPWRGATAHHELMKDLTHTTGVGVLLRDRDGGEVKVGKDGEPIAHYGLSDFDRGHLRTGIDGAARILEAAGARKIFSSHSRWVGYEPGKSGDRETFMAAADAAGYGAGQVTLGSFHIMGTAGMGGSAQNSACDPSGQTWDVEGLYVADGSSFPAASGVNPMISIESVAHMTASRLAAKLT